MMELIVLDRLEALVVNEPSVRDEELLPGFEAAPETVHRDYSRWDQARVGRFGFLIGRGHTAAVVAAAMGLTVHNAYRAARRFGLSFREGQKAREAAGVSRVSGAISQAAAKFGISIGELEDRLLSLVDADSCLLENILDGDIADQRAAA